MFLKKILVLVLFLTVFSTSGQGLNRLLEKSFSTISFGGGSSHYFGDLAPYSYPHLVLLTTPRWNGTVNYALNFNDRFGVRASFTYARLVGDDYTFSKWNIQKFTERQFRNLHFRNDIKEFTLISTINLTPLYNRNYLVRRTFVPYLLFGLGLYYHSPQARIATNTPEKGNWYSLGGLRTGDQLKPYSKVQMVAPLGMGLKFRINQDFDLNIEGGLRITPFDYLDDVGTREYVNPAAASDPKQAAFSNRSTEDFAARTGENRGTYFQQAASFVGKSISSPGAATGSNAVAGYGVSRRFASSRWDSYFLTQVTLTYYIGQKTYCPPIK
jgi:hypothetical protein